MMFEVISTREFMQGNEYRVHEEPEETEEDELTETAKATIPYLQEGEWVMPELARAMGVPMPRLWKAVNCLSRRYPVYAYKKSLKRWVVGLL